MHVCLDIAQFPSIQVGIDFPLTEVQAHILRAHAGDGGWAGIYAGTDSSAIPKCIQNALWLGDLIFGWSIQTPHIRIKSMADGEKNSFFLCSLFECEELYQLLQKTWASWDPVADFLYTEWLPEANLPNSAEVNSALLDHRLLPQYLEAHYHFLYHAVFLLLFLLGLSRT